MIYRFNINNVDYDIKILNETSSSSTYKKIDENHYNLNLSKDSVIVNQNKFINVGLEDVSAEIQRSNGGLVQLIEEDVIIETFSFKSSDVNYDDFRMVYTIKLVNPLIERYNNNKNIGLDLINTSKSRIPLTCPGFNSNIEDCFSIYNVLSEYVKFLYGTDYTLDSTFFKSTVKMYMSNASNVLKAGRNESYEKATVFNTTFQELFNDLKVLHNVRIYVTGKTVRIEPFKIFEAERLSLGITFDATENDYDGYLDSQLQYEYNESDNIQVETYKSTYNTDYFKDQQINYNNNGEELEHTLNGYTDLTGSVTAPDKFASTMWFYMISNDGVNVESETLDFVSQRQLNYSSQSGDYLPLEDNTILERSAPVNPEYYYLNTAAAYVEILSEEINLDAGTSIIAKKYINAYFDSLNATISDKQKVYGIATAYKIFTADASIKTTSKDWSDVATSNILEGKTKSNFRIYTENGTQHQDLVNIRGEWLWASVYDVVPNANEDILNITTSSASTVIVFQLSFAVLRRDGQYGERCKFIKFINQTFIDGTQTFLNKDLAFVNTVPENQFYDMYKSIWDFNNMTYENSSVQKKLKQGKSVLSLDKFTDFNVTGQVYTQFGLGDVESATINEFSRQIEIDGRYGNSYRLGIGNDIVNFNFSGLKTIQIYDNTIVCEAIIGTDLSTLIPEIQVSPYATYSELSTNYSNVVQINVLSEAGVSKMYDIIITIAKPRFQYEGVLVYGNANPYTSQRWVHNDGIINNGMSFSRYDSNINNGSVILDNDDINLITNLSCQGLKNLVDLTGFDSLVYLQMQTSVGVNFILPDNHYVTISLSENQLSQFDLIQFTNLDSCNIDLSNNNLDPNIPLFQIDNKGWVNGIIDVSGNGVLSSDGLIAKTSLQGKGWTVIND